MLVRFMGSAVQFMDNLVSAEFPKMTAMQRATKLDTICDAIAAVAKNGISPITFEIGKKSLLLEFTRVHAEAGRLVVLINHIKVQ